MRFAAGGLLALFALSALGAADPRLFPRPAELEPAIQFWTRVYTEIDTNSGFIHDDERLDVVYETISIPAGSSRREKSRELDRAFDRYRAILRKLGGGARQNLSPEEKRVLALFPDDVDNAELRRAANRLRFQLGQADRFRAGLIRSGAWKPYIYEVLAKQGLPRELAALPHVESSFDPTAYSKVGAAGMWQFMRSTGRRYMRIDNVVDERRDAFFSTRAAARLLEDNYSILQSWPLAITAYNHGVAGMRRAVAQQKTKDIEVIVRRYESRSFGFASRNFYTAFLAAVDVDAAPEKYFGRLSLDPPADTVVVTLPDYMSTRTLAAAFLVDQTTLRELNPALTTLVWGGDKYVPKGFELRLPRDIPGDPRQLLAAIPAEERYAAQSPDLHHRVSRGDTLSGIASQYRVSLASLMEVNGLSRRDIIRVGQMLTLPVNDATLAAVARRQREPAPSVEAVVASSTQAPALQAGVYVVQPGDSIERIARTLGVEQETLLALNDIANKNRIRVGQELRVAPAVTAAVLTLPAAAETSAPEESGLPEDTTAQASIEAAVAAAQELENATGCRFAALYCEGSAIAQALAMGADSVETAVEEITQDPTTALDTNVLASVQADLAADPSDYSVGADQTIEVQALETLGHYADWLKLRTQRLRDLNGMPFDRAVVIGQRVKLDFSRVSPADFERLRTAYQQSMQEAFFRSYQIVDIKDHVVRPGESLWVLAQRRYGVPVWLLRQYNPDLQLDNVMPGTVVKFPELKLIAPPESPEGVSA